MSIKSNVKNTPNQATQIFFSIVCSGGLEKKETSEMEVLFEDLENRYGEKIDLNVCEPRWKKSTLCVAAENKYAKTVSYLIDKGISVNSRTPSGRNALFYSVLVPNNSAVIAELIDRGTDCRAQDKDGNNFLEYMFENKVFNFCNFQTAIEHQPNLLDNSSSILKILMNEIRCGTSLTYDMENDFLRILSMVFKKNSFGIFDSKKGNDANVIKQLLRKDTAKTAKFLIDCGFPVPEYEKLREMNFQIRYGNSYMKPVEVVEEWKKERILKENALYSDPEESNDVDDIDIFKH